ncbi:hypothetical protein [Tessaracoccus sp. G1721]
MFPLLLVIVVFFIMVLITIFMTLISKARPPSSTHGSPLPQVPGGLDVGMLSGVPVQSPSSAAL